MKQVLFYCCLATLLLCIESAVVGIDLGSEFVKVSVVKPGSGIEIALNEQSKRKTFIYVGFRGDERYFGEDAYNLHTRFPSNMLTALTHFVGAPYNEDTLTMLKKDLLYPFFELVENERGTISIKISEEEIYTAEELLGMFLQYMKTNAEKYVEQPVGDCVLAVPAYYTMRQREAIIKAAELSKLNVLGVMLATEAAALHYGVQNRGFTETKQVIVFDMGSSKLEVGVYEFVPPDNSTAKKKSGDVLGTMARLSVAFDGKNGGRFFDAIIAGDIAREYKEKTKNDVLNMDNRAGYKAITKLMRAAQRSKEMLSANKQSLVSVEGIYDDMDFNTKLTREKFDELTQSLVQRALHTVEEATRKANLTVEDIDHVELMGGGSRVPALQAALQKWFGKPLGRSLNTDEAIALGTGFTAAKLSGAFRVRGFALSSYSIYNITFQLSPTEEVPNPAMRKLFEYPKLPSKKMISVNRTQDFNITLFMSVKDENNDIQYVPLQLYRLSTVNDSFHHMGFFKEDKIHNGSKSSMEIKFKMVDDGLIVLDTLIAKYDEIVNSTKKVKKVLNDTEIEEAAAEGKDQPEEEGEQKDEGEKDSEQPEAKAEEQAAEDEDAKEEAKEDEDKEGAEKKEDGATGEEGGKEGEGEEKKDEGADKKEKKKKKKKKVVYEEVPTLKTNSLKRTVTHELDYIFSPFPMNVTQLHSAKETLTRLNKRDEEKAKIAEAKNNLETLLYMTKYDKFFDDETLTPFYNESEAEAIREALKEVDEWLEEGEGVSATTKEYKGKIKYINSFVDPIYKRKQDKIDAEKKAEEERIAAIKKQEAEEKKKAKEEAKKAKAAAKAEGKEGGSEDSKEEEEDDEPETEEKAEEKEKPDDSDKEPDHDGDL